MTKLTKGQELRALEFISKYLDIVEPSINDLEELTDDLKTILIVSFAMNLNKDIPQRQPWEVYREFTNAAHKYLPTGIVPVESERILVMCFGIAKSGRKLEAVKFFKDHTGVGLKEAN